MTKTIHFCAGLPRSGSTVLMNILQQNPDVFTTSTCALSDLLHHHILIKSRYREFHQAMDADQVDKAMYGLIHGATQGWFSGLTEKPVVISKNRSWTHLLHLYPNSKTIAIIRDLRDIVESFEKLSNNILALHSFSNNNTMIPAMSQAEKYSYYFNEENAFSVALAQDLPRLMDRWVKNKNDTMFIRYEDFIKDPVYILKKIYWFLNLNNYEHDLNNIKQNELFEHDNAYFRERTSHKVKPVFQTYKEPIRTLDRSFQEKIVKNNEWFYKSFYPEVLNEF